MLSRIFRERELLIRSDGEVRFLRVSARMQMAVAAGLIGGTIWAATAVPVTITQFLTNSTNESQIFEAKLAYADLLDEVTEYQNTVGDVTSALSESRLQIESQLAEAREMERQLAGAGETLAGPRAVVANSREVLQGHLDQVNGSLASIANDGEELESMLAKIRSDLAGSDDGRQLVERARARLKERAEGLETRLASVVDKNLKVEELNAALSTNVQVTAAERDGLVKQRDNLRGNIKSLEADVAALVEERRMLEENRDELTASLASVRSENDNLSGERLSLQEQVAALDSELIMTRSKQDEVKADLRDAARSLQAVTGDSTVLGDTPHALRLQIDGLLADLTNQQAMEDAVLQRATDRAAGSVQEIEKIVAMSGLNIDKLLRRVESDGIGQGGPFIAASTDLPGDEELGETMLSLDNNMTRWESLKEVLRALPLSLPVDYYRLTSKYGGRIDPVNKKRSKHNGIDMAGAMNTSVYAPGPGIVVYSGTKGRYGNVVEIDHGFGIVTRFAHLNKTLVEVGDVVGHRQRVALLGNSGRSTGPHLHYEVRFDGRPMDPMKFIKAGRYVFKN
ncbi:MAG: peptidoglycan DD-metalloendopeptidase family protein [Alphaproteobacteria bacterium]|nr:peptidoglycan DD-metalloendopeptidase family protein [Alphaproteobacteria bacterium]